jgi:NH3-dependent NAD+ synthetase
MVIGVSGGLDSTRALIVAARAVDQRQWRHSEHPDPASIR